MKEFFSLLRLSLCKKSGSVPRGRTKIRTVTSPEWPYRWDVYSSFYVCVRYTVGVLNGVENIWHEGEKEYGPFPTRLHAEKFGKLQETETGRNRWHVILD